jgi:hypothetical protein
MTITARILTFSGLLAATGLLLSSMTEPLSAEQRVFRAFSFDDDWHYRGESVGRHNITGTKSGPFCDNSFCAVGYGELGTDYGWWYFGNFVDGLFEGSGEFQGDFYTYVGQFKAGKFHGHGVLTCLDGQYFEGNFVENVMIGDYKLSKDPNPSTRRFDGLKLSHGDYEPCKF